jgi:glycosyltransferase involved in cell wall biosynthesis
MGKPGDGSGDVQKIFHFIQTVGKVFFAGLLMKIAMLNTSDRRGGAAVAAYRLKEALSAGGVDVKLIVREKITPDPDVISMDNSGLRRNINRFRFLWERLVIFLHNGFSRERLFKVSLADTGVDVSRLPEIQEADIIHLHWFNHGFLSLRSLEKLLALGKPVVWTMHDMWAATGICHHSWACERYREGCGRCPFLHSSRQGDLSARIFRRKAALYHGNITLAPVSEWLAGKCQESASTAHLRVQAIPNSLDTDFFTPGDRAEARRTAGLPPDARIILMGAARIDDPIKGFSALKKLLHFIEPKMQCKIHLVLFGHIKNEQETLADIPVACTWLGRISDPEQLRTLYRAADVTVSPSHYETFGQTLSEALSCGCPAVSFGNSGQREIIDHRVNGWLADYPDPADLARGIEWVLSHPDPAGLAAHARKKVLDRFTAGQVAARYVELYESLLAPNNKTDRP